MIQLIYASYAAQSMTSADLQQLQAQSQANNQRKGITGLLLYKAGAFIQVLEGSEKDVISLYDSICLDTRHTHIRKLVQRRITEREFSKWAMRFHNLDTVVLPQLNLEDSSSFQKGLTKPKYVQMLLSTFLQVSP
jgi:DNA-binding FadR family transcriptional regulator